MRVPVYEVKVNGSNIPVRKINIDLPPKNLKARATIEAPKDVNLDIGDLVEITFFDVLLYRGEVTKIKETQEGKTFTVSYKSPVVPRIALTNSDLPDEDRRNAFKVIAKDGYAIDLFEELFQAYIHTLVNIGDPPPIKTRKHVVEGDLLQALADYYKEFAPIIYQDPTEKLVYVIWDAYNKTWNIPDKVILNYAITTEQGCDENSPIIVSNRPVRAVDIYGEKQKDNNPSTEMGSDSAGEDSPSKCSIPSMEIQTVSKGENSETVNVYKLDTKKRTLKLIKSITIRYGPIPRPAVPQIHVEGEGCGASTVETSPPIQEGIVEKRIKTYNEAGGYTEQIYKWVITDFHWVVTRISCGENGEFSQDLQPVPVYSFELAGETRSWSAETTEVINPEAPEHCQYEIVRRTLHTETKEYVYFPTEGGMLTVEDAIKFSNLKPEDEKVKTVVKVSTSETVTLRKKDTKTTIASISTKDGVPVSEFSLTENELIMKVLTPEGGELLPETVWSGVPQKKFRNIVHKDLDRNSVKWAAERVRTLCQKHKMKLELEVPLLPLLPGHILVALGRTWVIEGYAHRITPYRATTIVYGRLA